ncbi:MAG: alternative ribosome rescue aminoacyl-tRNA hydrolase ArfB [Bacteroidales bacterium]
MKPDELIERIPASELIFSSSRSSGPGGQNVNKVNTKVELRLKIRASAAFTEEERELICQKLKNKINLDGELIVTSQSERSQLKNREKATEKLFRLIAGALTEKTPRRSTNPSRRSKQERLEEKRKRSLIKRSRQEPDKGQSE